MPAPAPTDPTPSALPARFATTAWSVVLRAAAPDAFAARAALTELCRAYWFPLYAYHRRRGAAHPEAEDAVQGFFATLLEQNILKYADPDRGRFRGFLLCAFRQYLARQHEYDSAAKRRPPGGIVSLDTGTGETRFAKELTDTITPDRAFEYAWAVSVVRRAMDRLRTEQELAGRAERFDAFHGSLTGQSPHSARELGLRLGLTEGAVRIAVHRLRQRYGELLREEVAATVGGQADLEDELRHLQAALKPDRRV